MKERSKDQTDPKKNPKEIPMPKEISKESPKAVAPDTVSFPSPAKSVAIVFAWFKRYVDFNNMDSFIKDEYGTGKIQESFPIIVVAQMLSLFTLVIAVLFSAILAPGQTTPAYAQLLLTMAVIILAGGILIFYLTSGLLFAISRLLGGTGELAPQLRFMAIVTLCSNIITSPLAFISLFFAKDSMPAFALSIIVMVIGFYELFAFYKTLRAMHSISTLRALIALVGSLLVIYLISLFSFG
jgi:hypothetical protein